MVFAYGAERKNSLELHPPSHPLEHLKKVWQGFCDPRNSTSEDDDDNNDGPALNRTETSGSVEPNASLEISVAPIPLPPTATDKKVVVVTATATEETEIVLLLADNTKLVDILPPIEASNLGSSTKSAESDEKLQDPSSTQQIIPVRARRCPFVVESAFFTLGLLVFTLLALGRMGYKLEIEFRNKVTGNQSPSMINVNVSDGEQKAQISSQMPQADLLDEISVAPLSLGDEHMDETEHLDETVCETSHDDTLDPQSQPPLCVVNESNPTIDVL